MPSTLTDDEKVIVESLAKSFFDWLADDRGIGRTVLQASIETLSKTSSIAGDGADGFAFERLSSGFMFRPWRAVLPLFVKHVEEGNFPVAGRARVLGCFLTERCTTIAASVDVPLRRVPNGGHGSGTTHGTFVTFSSPAAPLRDASGVGRNEWQEQDCWACGAEGAMDIPVRSGASDAPLFCTLRSCDEDGQCADRLRTLLKDLAHVLGRVKERHDEQDARQAATFAIFTTINRCLACGLARGVWRSPFRSPSPSREAPMAAARSRPAVPSTAPATFWPACFPGGGRSQRRFHTLPGREDLP